MIESSGLSLFSAHLAPRWTLRLRWRKFQSALAISYIRRSLNGVETKVDALSCTNVRKKTNALAKSKKKNVTIRLAVVLVLTVSRKGESLLGLINSVVTNAIIVVQKLVSCSLTFSAAISRVSPPHTLIWSGWGPDIPLFARCFKLHKIFQSLLQAHAVLTPYFEFYASPCFLISFIVRNTCKTACTQGWPEVPVFDSIFFLDIFVFFLINSKENPISYRRLL